MMPTNQDKDHLRSVDEDTILDDGPFQPSSPKNTTSLLTVSIKSIRLFFCNKLELKNVNNDSLCPYNDDEISILTSNTFDRVIGKDLILHQDIKNYKTSSTDSSVISIFGQPHEVILSSIIHQTKMHRERSKSKKLQVLGIEGICCQLVGSSNISSGTLSPLNTHIQHDDNKPLDAVESLQYYSFFVRDDTKGNFLSGELVETHVNDDKTNNFVKGSVGVQALISRIYTTVNCQSLPKIFEFLKPLIPQYPSFPMSAFDHLRRKALDQKLSERNKSITLKQMNICCELHGLVLNVLIPDDYNRMHSKLFTLGSQDDNSLNSMSLSIGPARLQQGSFLYTNNDKPGGESRMIFSYLESFPGNDFTNLVSLCLFYCIFMHLVTI